MINNFMSKPYNLDKYEAGNALFDKYICSCNHKKAEDLSFTPFKVSTITSVSKIAESVDIKRLCQYLQCDDRIQYIKSKDLLKGKKKPKPEKKSVKKKKGKNQLFSNQMSIGLVCKNPKHEHKNPISVKVFKNGTIQMTGCKTLKEIETMYKILYDRLVQIPRVFYLGERSIIIETVKNPIPYKEENIHIEMLNGTFYIKSRLNLNKIIQCFQRDYSHKEVFINKPTKSKLTLSISKFSYIEKKKLKEPSCGIFNTGGINIIATKKDIFRKTYQFIKKHLKKYYEEIAERKIAMNDDFFESEEYRKFKEQFEADRVAELEEDDND